MKLAKARWAAMTAEAASPTLPRPPPWLPPLPPPLPPTLPHVAAAAEEPAVQFNPAACARKTVSRYWLSKCNLPALAATLAAAKLVVALLPTIDAATRMAHAQKGGFGTKAWHANVLAGMNLSPAQLASLRASIPAADLTARRLAAPLPQL